MAPSSKEGLCFDYKDRLHGLEAPSSHKRISICSNSPVSFRCHYCYGAVTNTHTHNRDTHTHTHTHTHLRDDQIIRNVIVTSLANS